MATITPCQPSTTGTNEYLVITIRVLAVVGISYLLKLLYQLIARLLFPHRFAPDRRDPAAEDPNGIDLNDIALATPASLELDFASYDGGDLGIRMPEPAYHPPGRR